MSPPPAVRFSGTNACWNEHEHFLLVCHFLAHRFSFQNKKTQMERENKANLIREAFRCCRNFEVVATKAQFDTPLATSSAQGNPTRRTSPESPSKNRSTNGKRKVSKGKTKNSITFPRQMLSELVFRSEQDLRHKQNTRNIKCLFDRS